MGRKHKSHDWKLISEALHFYRGLTWNSPGVQEGLFVQFGKEGVLSNRKTFIDKLTQMARSAKDGTGVLTVHNAMLEEAREQCMNEEAVSTDIPAKLLELDDALDSLKYDYKQDIAQLKDFN